MTAVEVTAGYTHTERIAQGSGQIIAYREAMCTVWLPRHESNRRVVWSINADNHPVEVEVRYGIYAMKIQGTSIAQLRSVLAGAWGIPTNAGATLIRRMSAGASFSVGGPQADWMTLHDGDQITFS